jgi:hypothetical protein
MLFQQAVLIPEYFALAKAGSSMPAKMAMIATTTSSSIKVNARQRLVLQKFTRSASC